MDDLKEKKNSTERDKIKIKKIFTSTIKILCISLPPSVIGLRSYVFYLLQRFSGWLISSIHLSATRSKTRRRKKNVNAIKIVGKFSGFLARFVCFFLLLSHTLAVVLLYIMVGYEMKRNGH